MDTAHVMINDDPAPQPTEAAGEPPLEQSASLERESGTSHATQKQ